jgi:hypothetical protein
VEIQTGKHLRQVLLSTGSLVALLVIVIGAIAGGIAADWWAVAAFVAGAGVIFWFLIDLVIASRRAHRDFYAAYAQQRGLQWVHHTSIPEATPLLRRGDERRADEAFTGQLPGGLQGELALYTYEERSSDGTGRDAKEIHHFTIVVSQLPDIGGRLPGLFVQRRSGFRFLDGAEDVFRSTERVRLESEELDRKCEIFADRGCDANWLRQLFDPVFVDFLAEKSPDGFAFEVQHGVLCVNVNRHRGKAAELDEICTSAATVAKRITEEAAE